MKARRHPSSEYLPWEEIRPVVELAGFAAIEEDTHYNYRNPAHHLILVEGGHVQCDPPGASFVAVSGDLICFRPAERNRYAVRPNTVFYQAVIQFAPPPRHLFTPIWDDVGPLPVKVSLGDSTPAMRRHFETLCVELPYAGSVHQMRVRAAVFEILAIIAGLTHTGGARVVPENPWHRTRLMLESQLAGELRVDQLARQMGMSVNHFIRQFRKHFGTTPKAYHTRVRLREGARLLRDPERSVKSIAYLLGFSDTKTFSRRFQHHFGINPSDLRSAELTGPGAPESLRPPTGLLYSANQPSLPPYAGPDYLEGFHARGDK